MGDVSVSDNSSDSGTDDISDLDAFDDFPDPYAATKRNWNGRNGADSNGDKKGTTPHLKGVHGVHTPQQSNAPLQLKGPVVPVSMRPVTSISNEVTVVSTMPMSEQGLTSSSTGSVRMQVNEKKINYNINTQFEWGHPSQSKSLKHIILEKCVESLRTKIDEVKNTGKPGKLKWTVSFGVELVWNIHHKELKAKGFTQNNLKKSIERVVAMVQKKAPTGMGDIGETPAVLKPSREENTEDMDNEAYTKTLVEDVLSLKSILDEEVKELMNVEDHTPKKNPCNYETSQVTDKDDASNCAKVPVGLYLGNGIAKRKAACDARSDAALGLDLDTKRRKGESSKEIKSTDPFSELASSIKDLTALRIQREKEKAEQEREEREERKMLKEEERKEKRKQEERKEEERKREAKDSEKEKSKTDDTMKALKKDLEEKIKEQVKEALDEKFDGFKSYLEKMLKK